MLYYLYNFILKTDICFEMLVECDRSLRDEDIVVSLFVNKELEEEPEYIVPFKEDIRYYLYPKKNEIYVETGDLIYLYSSFFNIPMSVFSLFNNKAIIHCNALEFNNELYCFSGNKAIGKTTLAMFLGKYCSIFSDDCVAIDSCSDGRVYGYRAAHTLKLSRKTYDIVINDNCYEEHFDNLSQKSNILLPDMQYKKTPIKKMFFLVRGNDKEFVCDKVESLITKKVLLIQSIVGKDYIPKSVIDIFGRTKLFSETIAQVPFYILKIPPIEEYNSKIQIFFNTMIK